MYSWRRTGFPMRLLFIAAAICGFSTVATGAPEALPTTPLILNIPAPEIISGVSNPPLDGITLSLSQNARLGKRFIPAEQVAGGCIEKPARAIRFCIDPINWPVALSEAFGKSGTLYKGTQAVILYSENISAQAHVLFPSDQFITVIEHLKNRYGPPSSEDAVISQVPERPPVVNTVVRWRSIMDDGSADMVLEVRAYDDVRRPFPDTSHGFIWLHRKGDVPVFRLFSTIDMMVLRQRRIGQWPYPDQSPEKSTLR